MYCTGASVSGALASVLDLYGVWLWLHRTTGAAMSEPYYEDDRVVVHAGDCLDVLATLPDASVDSVVTDPPYGLEFMGKDWDAPWKSSDSVRARARTARSAAVVNKFEAGRPFQAWCAQWATECLRVLKPGGHLLAFGGTRTSHRLACAIEDAGFEIRDSIAWLYGSGFPKSLDVGKAIDAVAGVGREVVGLAQGSAMRSAVSFQAHDKPTGYNATPEGQRLATAPATDDARTWQGWGTALKPAHEPIVVARKPLVGTVAANVLAHGTGALNVDGCRVETDDPLSGGRYADLPDLPDGAAYGSGINRRSRAEFTQPAGRWPANVCLSEDQADALDQQSGFRRPGERPASAGITSSPGANGTLGAGWSGPNQEKREVVDDGGGASRFFYVAREDNDSCPSTEPASTVASPSSHPNANAASAPADAQTLAFPDGDQPTRSASTNATPNGSRTTDANGTPTTPTIADESQPDWQPVKPSQMVSRAKYAASLAPTDTTTTTTDPSTSDGSAVPATSSITSRSKGHGEADLLGDLPRFRYEAKAPSHERPRVNGIAHPTCKPLALMRWLVRLVTPPGGLVLDPFAGSGTTVEACLLEGFRCIAIEREADYLPLITSRLRQGVLDFGSAS